MGADAEEGAAAADAAGGAPPPPTQPARTIGDAGLRKRTLKAVNAVAHEARGLATEERARFLNTVLGHDKVNDMCVAAGVQTADQAGVDKYIVDNIAAHTGGDGAIRRGQDATSMAVKRLAVTIATTAATGRKRGGDGILQAAVEQRLKLGRSNLVAKGS